MKKLYSYKRKLFALLILILPIIILDSCKSSKMGGTIPVFMDEYVSTTEKRRFTLKEEIEGYIIEYQKSYNCNNDSIRSNATAIVSHESTFLTIYDYCQQRELKKGSKVIIKPKNMLNENWYIREIYKSFPKKSENYGYWQCISCKYKNTFGSIELVKE